MVRQSRKAPCLYWHVYRSRKSCIFTRKKWYRQFGDPGTRALLNTEVADTQLRPTRENGGREELRNSLLGREVGSCVHRPLERGGPSEGGPVWPGAAVHTQLSAVLLGLDPNSPLGALSGHQGPGKNDQEAA